MGVNLSVIQFHQAIGELSNSAPTISSHAELTIGVNIETKRGKLCVQKQMRSCRKFSSHGLSIPFFVLHANRSHFYFSTTHLLVYL